MRTTPARASATPATVGGDKGRLNVVHTRGTPRGKWPKLVVAPDKDDRERTPDAVEVNDHAVLASAQLPGPRAGQRFVVRGQFSARAKGLAHPARISSQIFLSGHSGTTDRDSHDPGVEAGALHGEVCEHNGFNCIPGDDWKQVRKAGILQIANEPAGPLYVNFVADAGNPTKKLAGGDAVSIRGVRLEISPLPPDQEGSRAAPARERL